jgi:hypothetical protein
MLEHHLELEPTRSVLYRSAASLALDCSEFAEAERLIASGLAGYPPSEIAEELRDLYERVTFYRHLAPRGISLSIDEIQMSLHGNATSLGVIRAGLFTNRVELLKNLLIRTIERMLEQPYRDKGISKIQSAYPLYLSVPRAASFAISVKVGIPKEPMFPLVAELVGDTKIIEARHIFNEIMLCLDLFNRSEEDELRRRFDQRRYYPNFVRLARHIAPDGKGIRQVGFTTYSDSRENTLSLDKTRNEVKISADETGDDLAEEEISIVGRLLLADARRGRLPNIGLEDDQGHHYKITVPEDVIDDIVRPYFDQMVRITGYKTEERNEIRFIDIEPLMDD